MTLLAFVLFGLSFCGSLGWERLPEIPSGRRSEFYVLHENGQYKYGYDTGNGIAAKQSGDAANQVEGHYFYNTPEGKKFDLQYSAGIQGFVPNGLKNDDNGSSMPPVMNQPPSSENKNTLAYGSLNPDGSYKFGFKTDDQSRDESGDANNNVNGRYSYKNSAGSHDLSYVAGSETGFKPTGGSLAIPNGLPTAISNNNNIPPSGMNPQAPSPSANNPGTLAYGSLNSDGSYKFGFKTNDQSRDESGDANNNVQGSYSYKNSAGSHDLSYVAGSQTGFKPTGGSLAIPNGLPTLSNNIPSTTTIPLIHNGNSVGSNQQPPSQGSNTNTLAYGSLNPDGSYKFGFKTNDQARDESGDANSNVQGSYSYKNSAGSHDLSYVAGSETGFKPTGGSLSIPNGLPNTISNNNNIPPSGMNQQPNPSSPNNQDTLAYGSLNPDGSYKFGFKTNDQSRDESGDANNNVQGSYSYKNSAGSHDLSYVAGSQTGFKPTGGSLAIPNGLPSITNNMSPVTNIPLIHNSNPIESTQQQPSQGSNTNTLAYGSLNPDGSYKFGFKTNDQSRDESGDANNNVQGSYSYKNSAGSHDLSYIAGAKTGFKPTDGSLAVPNGLPNPSSNANNITTSGINQQSGMNPQAPSPSTNNQDTLAYGSLNPDGSYKFGFKTEDQTRDESGDTNNNVKGRYSYKNSAGSHDLSYVAGSETGFKPTGGSLAIPNGLQNMQNLGNSAKNGLNSQSSISQPPSQTGISKPPQDTKFSQQFGNLAVHTYLPPSNEKHKFGYIFDTNQ